MVALEDEVGADYVVRVLPEASLFVDAAGAAAHVDLGVAPVLGLTESADFLQQSMYLAVLTVADAHPLDVGVISARRPLADHLVRIPLARRQLL